MRKSPTELSLSRRPIAVPALLLIVPLLMPPSCAAAAITFSGTAVTTNQSIWKPGSASLFEWLARYDSPRARSSSFVGPGIDCTLGCNGYEAEISGAAQIGIVFEVAARAGSANASIPVSSNITAPDTARAGGTFNVRASPLTFGLGSLSTTGSGIYAGAAMNLALAASFTGEVCALDSCTEFGENGNLLDFDTSFNLFELNRNNNGLLEVANGKLTYPLGYSFKPTDFLSGSFQLPRGPNTQGTGITTLRSSGTSELVNLDFNVTNLATEAARLPPLSGTLGGCCGLTLDYNLFSVDIITALNVSQNFTLLPSANLFLNVQQTGQRIRVSQADTAIFFPEGQTRLDIVPEIEVSGTFSNTLGLCVQPSLSISGLGGKLNVAGGSAASFGPLFHEVYSPGCFGGDVHTETFELGGFSTIHGDAFSVFAAGMGPEPGPAPVPEPATSVMTGLALMLLGFAANRGRGVRKIIPLADRKRPSID